jgi:putative tryptophan/tyrosine transport system substrate-binding protein
MAKRFANLLVFGLLLTFAALHATAAFAETKTARVGVLSWRHGEDSPDETRRWYEPFTRSLAQAGWVEGRNLSVVYFFPTDFGPSQLAATARQLVQQKIDVIFADSAPSTQAAFAVTRDIPIVALDFTNDPVAVGYAESYGRPGKNVTGVFLDAPEFAGKWFELLTAVVPHLTRVAALYDPAPGTAHLRAVQSVARGRGMALEVKEVHTPEDLDRAFSGFLKRPQAVVMLPAPLTYTQAKRLGQLAVKHRLPATSMARVFAESGGAMSYGPVQAAVYERCGIFAAKILNGTKPGELPVERPAKFELLVNLKATEKLGLKLPEAVLLRADELIR